MTGCEGAQRLADHLRGVPASRQHPRRDEHLGHPTAPAPGPPRPPPRASPTRQAYQPATSVTHPPSGPEQARHRTRPAARSASRPALDRQTITPSTPHHRSVPDHPGGGKGQLVLHPARPKQRCPPRSVPTPDKATRCQSPTRSPASSQATDPILAGPPADDTVSINDPSCPRRVVS